jgi:hypothetical protein
MRSRSSINAASTEALARCGFSLVVLSALMLAGCAGDSGPPAVYKLYPGPMRPVAELATVKLGDAYAVVVDGLTASHGDWDMVVLPPGHHRLDCMVEYGASVVLEPTGLGHATSRLESNLTAGRTYVIRFARSYGQHRHAWLWLEDVETGEVVAGRKKP